MFESRIGVLDRGRPGHKTIQVFFDNGSEAEWLELEVPAQHLDKALERIRELIRQHTRPSSTMVEAIS